MQPYAYEVRISTAGTMVLNFIECFAFSSSGQNVAAAALGATAAWTSGTQYQTQAAMYGNDLGTDPWIAASAVPQRIAGSSGGATWTVKFAPVNAFPLGQPFPISSGESDESSRPREVSHRRRLGAVARVEPTAAADFDTPPRATRS